MTLLGHLALWLAFLVGLWGAVTGFAGGIQGRADLQQSARHAVYAMCGALLVAVVCLEVAIFRHDFNVEYVAAYTSRNLPTFYLWSALYAGQKGSLLFWAAVLSVFAALTQMLTGARHRAYLPYVAGVTCVVATFFVTVLLFAANPFERLAFTPMDGRGMNPQLQNPGMVFHPPMLYLGYISITIPFAFAIAALASKRLEADWLVAIRKWTLVSWLFLAVGLLLGMWWAYVELGWGGYWAWDPVENAALLPWLTMTAFLHSVMIQEKRGMLKKWNLALVIGAWLLSIFGTFLTRSGVIASVHSFTQSPVGYFFLVFLVVAATLSFWLYATRLPLLEAEAKLESMVSREASFLFNNLLLIGIAFAVLWGTLLPILSEAVTGVKITVAAPWFNDVIVPIGLALLLLTGIGPLVAWRRASIPNLKRQFAVPASAGVFVLLILLVAGMRDVYALLAIAFGGFVTATVIQEFGRGASARHRQYGEPIVRACVQLVARNRRRYGGYIVHIGIVLLFFAFAGMAFKTETQATLRPGESATLRSPSGHVYTFTHLGISQYDALNRKVTAALVDVQRDGRPAGRLKTEKRQHVDGLGRPTFEPSTEVGIKSGLREDLYVVLGGLVDGTEQAVYRFTINPLVWWVWFGGYVLLLGGLVVLWPGGGGRLAGRAADAGGIRGETGGGMTERWKDGRLECERRDFLGIAFASVLSVLPTFQPSNVVQDSLAGSGPAGKVWDPARAGRPLTPITAADNDAAIQAIEKQLRCTCGCGLDIYTCRTTDFNCTYSPGLHREVVALADQGKTAQEILDAFVAQYGVATLMAPPKRGFNLAGYFVPSLAVLVAAAFLIRTLRRWTRAAAADAAAAPAPHPGSAAGPDASPAELERLRRELERLPG